MDTKCNFFIKKSKRNCKLNHISNSLFCKRHSNTVKPKYNLQRETECQICTEEFDVNDNPLICGHYIHRHCVVNWGKNVCPVCRTNIPMTNKELEKIEQVNEKFRENERTQEDNMTEEEIRQAFIDIVGIENILGREATLMHPLLVNEMMNSYLLISRMLS